MLILLILSPLMGGCRKKSPLKSTRQTSQNVLENSSHQPRAIKPTGKPLALPKSLEPIPSKVIPAPAIGKSHPFWQLMPRDAAAALIMNPWRLAQGKDTPDAPTLGPKSKALPLPGLGSMTAPSRKDASPLSPEGILKLFRHHVADFLNPGASTTAKTPLIEKIRHCGLVPEQNYGLMLDRKQKSLFLIAPIYGPNRWFHCLNSSIRRFGEVLFTRRTSKLGVITLWLKKKPFLHYAVAKGLLFIELPSSAYIKSRLPRLLSLPVGKSLAKSKSFILAASKINSANRLMLYLSPLGISKKQITNHGPLMTEEKKIRLGQLFKEFQSLVLSLDIRKNKATTEAYIAASAPKSWKKIFILPRSAAKASLQRHLPGKAIATFHLSVHLPALMESLLEIDPSLRLRLKRVSAVLKTRLGFHIEKDIFKTLTGNLALAFYGFNPAFGAMVFDPKRKDLVLNETNIAVVLEISNSKGLDWILANAARILEKSNSKYSFQARDVAGVQRYVLKNGEHSLLHIAIKKKILALATQGQLLSKILSRSDKSGLAHPSRNSFVSAFLSPAGLTRTLSLLNLSPTHRHQKALRNTLKNYLFPILKQLSNITMDFKYDGAGIKGELTFSRR